MQGIGGKRKVAIVHSLGCETVVIGMCPIHRRAVRPNDAKQERWRTGIGTPCEALKDQVAACGKRTALTTVGALQPHGTNERTEPLHFLGLWRLGPAFLFMIGEVLARHVKALALEADLSLMQP